MYYLPKGKPSISAETSGALEVADVKVRLWGDLVVVGDDDDDALEDDVVVVVVIVVGSMVAETRYLIRIL